jgi:uncharacterized protein YbjT (DUF2867 family)
MKVVVIGGSGLIGTKLVKNLRERGQQVVAATPSSGANTSLVTNWLKRWAVRRRISLDVTQL